MVTILVAVFEVFLCILTTAAVLVFLWYRYSSETKWRAPSTTCALFERRSRKGKEPAVFSGKPLEFTEWCFFIEEALAIVPPSEEVRFVVSYLAGDALRWFITKYPGDERPKGWSALKSDLKAAFSPEFEKAWYRTQLLKIRQTGTLDAYIAEFRSLCMLAPEVDELTKVLFCRFVCSLCSPA